MEDVGITVIARRKIIKIWFIAPRRGLRVDIAAKKIAKREMTTLESFVLQRTMQDLWEK